MSYGTSTRRDQRRKTALSNLEKRAKEYTEKLDRAKADLKQAKDGDKTRLDQYVKNWQDRLQKNLTTQQNTKKNMGKGSAALGR